MPDTIDLAQAGIELRHKAALDQGQFLIAQCGACSKFHYYPRENCPFCGSGQVSLVAPKGTGEVYSFTVVARKADAGGDYNVVLVDLAEGVRLMSRVEGVDPHSVKIGQRVKTRVQVTDGRGLVVCDLA
jgi:hypothetical protein